MIPIAPKIVYSPSPDWSQSEIERLRAENARLREALEKIAALDVPPSVMTRYREDEQPSEDDLCPHLLPMSEDCPDCIADYARAALAEKEEK